MHYAEMSKAALLKVAKDFEIIGRHDMSKDDLLEAIQAEAGDEDEAETEVELANKDQLLSLKRRRPSPAARDDGGRVIRKGRNLSGNIPYARKYYALNEAVADESSWTQTYREAETAAPGQVRLILKFMRQHGVVGEDGMLGHEIVEGAIAAGLLKTRIDPRGLFAYYRRLLEALGVEHLQEVE